MYALYARMPCVRAPRSPVCVCAGVKLCTRARSHNFFLTLHQCGNFAGTASARSASSACPPSSRPVLSSRYAAIPACAAHSRGCCSRGGTSATGAEGVAKSCRAGRTAWLQTVRSWSRNRPTLRACRSHRRISHGATPGPNRRREISASSANRYASRSQLT